MLPSDVGSSFSSVCLTCVTLHTTRTPHPSVVLDSLSLSLSLYISPSLSVSFSLSLSLCFCASLSLFFLLVALSHVPFLSLSRILRIFLHAVSLGIRVEVIHRAPLAALPPHRPSDCSWAWYKVVLICPLPFIYWIKGTLQAKADVTACASHAVRG